MLIILTGSVAAVAVGFAEYFSYFVPALSMRRQVASLPLPWGAFEVSAGQIVAALSIALLGAVNYVGIRTGNAVQVSFTVIKVAALAFIPLVAFSVQRVDPAFTPVIPDVPRLGPAVGVAMVAVMWTYEGWYQAASAAGEIRHPARNVPLALIAGTLALTAIYVVVNAAYVYALSLPEMAGVERIAEKAVTALVGPIGGSLVAATVAVSTLGANAAGVIGMSRVCFAMAADGLFFRPAAAVHPRFRTPHVAIVLTCAWSAVLAISGSYEQIFTYVIFASVAFFVAGGLAIFRLRRIRPDAPRPYRTWGYPVVPGLFVLGSGALVLNTLVERPVQSLAGLGFVALGLPAFWYWNRQRPTNDR